MSSSGSSYIRTENANQMKSSKSYWGHFERNVVRQSQAGQNKCHNRVELAATVAHFAARPIGHQVDVSVRTSSDAVDVSSPGRAVVHAQSVFLVQNHFSLKSIVLCSLVMQYFSCISPKDFTKLSWKLLRKKECEIASLIVSTWFSSIQYCASGIVWNSTKQYRKDCPIRNESTSIYCLEMSRNHLSESKHEKCGRCVGRCRYVCLVNCSKFIKSQVANVADYFKSHLFLWTSWVSLPSGWFQLLKIHLSPERLKHLAQIMPRMAGCKLKKTTNILFCSLHWQIPHKYHIVWYAVIPSTFGIAASVAVILERMKKTGIAKISLAFRIDCIGNEIHIWNTYSSRTGWRIIMVIVSWPGMVIFVAPGITIIIVIIPWPSGAVILSTPALKEQH